MSYFLKKGGGGWPGGMQGFGAIPRGDGGDTGIVPPGLIDPVFHPPTPLPPIPLPPMLPPDVIASPPMLPPDVIASPPVTSPASSSISLKTIGIVAAVGVGAWYLFFRKPGGA